jgi:Trk K+ transport system NAD-binding subunit
MQQVAMLEGNRYEVLDVTTRESSRYIGQTFRDMPVHGALIGAIVRDELDNGGVQLVLVAHGRRARCRDLIPAA